MSTTAASFELDEQTRAAFDQVPTPLWVSGPGKESLYFNQAWVRFTGRGLDECITEGWWSSVHPDDQRVTLSHCEAAFIARQPFMLTFRLRHHDGEYRWMRDQAEPRYTPDGAFAGYVGVCVDITDEHEASTALAESERRFRDIFDRAAIGIALLNAQGRYHMVNRELCRITGYEEGELLRLGFRDITHPEDLPEDDAQARLLYGGQIDNYSLEKRYRRKDGSEVWVNLTASAIRDEKGRVRQVVAMIEDISERKDAEGQLIQLNETLELRVAERTTSMVRYQEQLRALASELTLAEQRERRQLAAHLHDYLAQLLIVCRMRLTQAQRVVRSVKAQALMIEVDEVLGKCLKYTRTMISDLSPTILYESGLAVAVRWLAEQMQRHELTVTVETDQEKIQLQEDEAVLVFDAIRELLFNVIKHAGVPRAEVSLKQGGGELCVTVVDRGAGFDSNQQMRPTEAGKFGLFSVRERLEAMGGRLEISSSAGAGTAVTLVVPLRPPLVVPPEVDDELEPDAPPAPSPTVRDSDDKPQRRKCIRVLLVDDHNMVREGLRSVIESYSGIEVAAEATNGEEALQLAHALRPDVVVMDVNMPRMNGIEATRRITQDLPEIVVVGLSVNDDGETAAAMMDAGASAFLTKGGPSEQLNRAIRSCRAKK